MPFTYTFVPSYVHSAVKFSVGIEMHTWSETKQFESNEITLFDKPILEIIKEKEKEDIAKQDISK